MANRGWYDDDRDKVTGQPLWQQLLDKFPENDEDIEAAFDHLSRLAFIPSSPPAPSVSGSKPAVADSPRSPSPSERGESANGPID